MSDDFVIAYDEHGRETKIARGEWAAKVLPANLAKAWSNPDGLYEQIFFALRDRFHAQVISAARHLAEIDPDSNRAAVILGIVLTKNGDLDGAEAVLEAALKSGGPNGVSLTNLAKVYAERGDQARADVTLREALRVDPNQDNALQWYALRERERRGFHDAYLLALVEISSEKDAWRPQLLMAREYLRDGQCSTALALIKQILPQMCSDPIALTNISGDLGNAGLLREMVDLIGPVYDPIRCGPHAGVNLAAAMLEVNELERGTVLVDALKRLKYVPLARQIDELSQRFADRRKEASRKAIGGKQ